MIEIDWHQNPDNVKRQLGRCKHSRRSLQKISNSRETHRQMEIMRQYLSPKSKQSSLERANTNILEINDASQARGLRAVPCRVRSQKSIRRLTLGDRQETFYGVHSPRQEVPSIREDIPDVLSSGVPSQQHCEVLGHHACSECTKTKRTKLYSQEVQDTFPYIEMNQRALCANRRVNMTSQRSQPISLPDLSTSSAHTGATSSAASATLVPPFSSCTVTPYHQHLRSTRFTITDTELQLRVMEARRKGSGKQFKQIIAPRKASLYPEVTQQKPRLVVQVPMVSRDCTYASESDTGASLGLLSGGGRRGWKQGPNRPK